MDKAAQASSSLYSPSPSFSPFLLLTTGRGSTCTQSTARAIYFTCNCINCIHQAYNLQQQLLQTVIHSDVGVFNPDL